MENDEAVSRPSHRSLEDADAAGVSHIPPAPNGDSALFLEAQTQAVPLVLLLCWWRLLLRNLIGWRAGLLLST